MALTVARRKLKTLALARKYKRRGLLITSIGCAILATTPRLRRTAMVLILVGASMYVKTRIIIQSLPNPYAFRYLFAYGRRSLESFEPDLYDDRFRFPKSSVISHLNFFTRFANFPLVVETPYQVMNKGRPAMRKYVFNIDELYLMFLRYLATPMRQLEVAVEFGRTPQEVSRGIIWFHRQLEPVAKLYLQNDNQDWFTFQVARDCAEATRKKGCPVDPCVGFVDGVNKRIAKPSISWLQTATYNGHKKHCGLNWSGCVVSNGMALLVLGPSPGRRHDAAVAAEHNLYEKLEALASFPQNGFRGCYGGDSAYPVYWPIMPLYGPALTQRQVLWNQRMSSCRVSVEWLFGQQILQFSSLDWLIRCKVLASPVKEAYLNACFLTNLLNTRYPNIISQYFECTPPTLEQYLNVPAGSLI